MDYISPTKNNSVTEPSRAPEPNVTEVATLWGKPEIQKPHEEESVSASAAGNNLVLIFGNLQVELNSADQPLQGTALVSARAPLTPDENRPFLGYMISFEGAVIKNANSRATLVADVAGALKAFEFPQGEQRGLDGQDTSFRFELFGIERRAAKSQYAGGLRPPLAPCRISFLLSGQRLSPQDLGLSVSTL